MKTIGNILWVIFGGFFWCLTLLVSGLIMCVTIVGIPLGLQLFKLAKFVLWPFGKSVTKVNITGMKKVLNIIWAVLLGWEFALGYLFTGLLWCITIVGIPFGKQYFKIAHFVLLPLGRDFEK